MIIQLRHEAELFDTLVNVHSSHDCDGEVCPIHNATDHAMRTWPIIWRNDFGIFERYCEHGVGHPDPDQFPFWSATGQEWQGLHGCDGCCRDY